jgi:hypothetical protein
MQAGVTSNAGQKVEGERNRSKNNKKRGKGPDRSGVEVLLVFNLSSAIYLSLALFQENSLYISPATSLR